MDQQKGRTYDLSDEWIKEYTAKELGSRYGSPKPEGLMSWNAARVLRCSPGVILSKQALFEENACPTEEGVRVGSPANVCHAQVMSKWFRRFLLSLWQESSVSVEDLDEVQ